MRAVTNRLVAAGCQIYRDAGSDYLDGYVNAEEHDSFRSHLGRCQHCCEFVDELASTVQALRKLRIRDLRPDTEAEYLRLFHGATAEVDTPVPEPNSEALWADLQRIPQSLRPEFIGEHSHFHSHRFCEWMASEARRASHMEAMRALDLAETAIHVGRNLPPGRGRADLLAECWIAKTMSRLRLSDVMGASQDVRRAEQHFAQGTGKRKTEARLTALQAELPSILGRSKEAVSKYEESLRLFAESGDRTAVICTWVNIGGEHLRAGRAEEALSVLQQAVPLIRDGDRPDLAFCGLLNLGIAFCELKRATEAESLFPRLVELSSRLKGDTAIHLKWLRGSVLRAKNDWSGALGAFREVRSIFSGRGEWVHYVESSLDIARVHLARSDWLALSFLVREARLGANRMAADAECLQALSLLEEAAAQRTLGEAGLRTLGAWLAGRSAWRGASL